MLEGVCPACSGSVTTTVHECEDHDATAGSLCGQCGSAVPIQTGFVCDVCKFEWATPAYAAIFTDERVRCFFTEHDIAFDEHFDTSRMKPVRDAISDVTLRGEDPVEMSVTVAIDGDRLEVTLDETATVVDVARPPA